MLPARLHLVALAAMAVVLPDAAKAQTGLVVPARPAVVASPTVAVIAPRAATAAESRLRGVAALRTATAAAAYGHAQAAVVRQQARAAALRNEAQRCQLRQLQRSRYAAALAARTSEAAARNALRRARREEEMLQRQREPILLANDAWPPALRGNRYNQLRREVAELLAERSPEDAAPPEADAALRLALRRLARQTVADADAGAITADEFEVARAFVRSLPQRDWDRSGATERPRSNEALLALSDR